MKRCTTCGIRKRKAEFHNKAAAKDKLAPQCKDCVRVSNSAWKKANPAKVAAAHARWRKSHLKHIAAGKRARRAKNPEKAQQQNSIRVARFKCARPGRSLALTAAWKRSHPAEVNAQCAERKSRKRCAMPRWADASAIRVKYSQAQRETARTGVKHVVDHMVPLVSSRVCGLHTEQNLQVIAERPNLYKGNRFWPDMWEQAYG